MHLLQCAKPREILSRRKDISLPKKRESKFLNLCVEDANVLSPFFRKNSVKSVNVAKILPFSRIFFLVRVEFHGFLNMKSFHVFSVKILSYSIVLQISHKNQAPSPR